MKVSPKVRTPNVHFRPYDGGIIKFNASSFLEFSEQSEHSGACDHRTILLHQHVLNAV